MMPRCILLGGLLATQGMAEQVPAALHYIESNTPGTARAVIVGPQSLVYTTQVSGSPADGESPRVGARPQVEQTLENLSRALEAAGANLEHVVRINVYVTDASVTPEVQKAFARRFVGPAARPAVTFMEGKLPAPGALVAMDAVAAAPSQTGMSVDKFRAPRALGADPYGSHAAILPVGPVLFISGREEPGAPESAARAVLALLGADLSHLKLEKRDVVQMKAFVRADAVGIVREEIRRFFDNTDVPPLVFVEWRSPNRSVEIELVAAAPIRSGPPPSAAVEFFTPPGDRTYPLFTRLVRVNRGRLIYTSGLLGREEDKPEPRLRGIFSELRELLALAGSDFDHMAKATYYVTDEPSSALLNTVRAELYNPSRAPAASKINVTGVGVSGRTATVDLIAVAP